jgi:hypothetical protein
VVASAVVVVLVRLVAFAIPILLLSMVREI